MRESPTKFRHPRTVPGFKEVVTPVEAYLLEAGNLLHEATRIQAEEKFVDVKIVVYRFACEPRMPIHRVRPVLKRVDGALAAGRPRPALRHRHIVEPCGGGTYRFHPKPFFPAERRRGIDVDQFFNLWGKEFVLPDVRIRLYGH